MAITQNKHGENRHVYHRSLNLDGIFKANREEKICVTFVADEKVFMRAILLNERLCLNRNMWAYANLVLGPLDVGLGFSKMDKKEYLRLVAMDNFASAGNSNFLPISNDIQFIKAVDSAVQVVTATRLEENGMDGQYIFAGAAESKEDDIYSYQ